MINLLGIPFDGNSSFLRGPAYAPPRIRLMDRDGSANPFAENGLEIVEGRSYRDLGDLSFPDSDPASVFKRIREEVANNLANGSRLVLFGGDHSITYPVIDAYADGYDGLNILHFDAHPDLHENFENNPYSHASPFARILESGKVGSLTQVGIRTFNTHQRQQVARYGVKVIEMKDFSLDFISALEGPLYVSLDLDVLDPAFAPGISHHEPGGLSTRELITIIQKISVPVVGADIVEYNPMRDVNNMTAMVAYKLFKELVAKINESVLPERISNP
jgi:arginase